VFLENILYGKPAPRVKSRNPDPHQFSGFYLAVFLESCIILARKQKSRNLKQMFVLGTAIALFIFITLVGRPFTQAYCIFDICCAASDVQ
jgi:hypothetical protein